LDEGYFFVRGSEPYGDGGDGIAVAVLVAFGDFIGSEGEMFF